MAKKQAVNGERGHWSAKAKLGIFLASVVSAVAGLALLAWLPARRRHPEVARS